MPKRAMKLLFSRGSGKIDTIRCTFRSFLHACCRGAAMKSRFCHYLLPLAALALCAALLVLTAAAAPVNEQESVRAAVEAGRYKPLASILAQVEYEWPGARVLELDTKQGAQGQLYYEVKLLDRAGVRRKLLLDAASGRDLSASSKAQQAAPLRKLAEYLRRVEDESGQRVVEAELELGADGQMVYLLLLAPSVASAQRRLMDASSGRLLWIEPSSEGNSLRSIPEVLEALADKGPGEVKAYDVSVYYEIDLRIDGKHTLELQVDARTLRVLKSSYTRK